jgi:hypothetical protein
MILEIDIGELWNQQISVLRGILNLNDSLKRLSLQIQTLLNSMTPSSISQICTLTCAIRSLLRVGCNYYLGSQPRQKNL